MEAILGGITDLAYSIRGNWGILILGNIFLFISINTNLKFSTNRYTDIIIQMIRLLALHNCLQK